MATKDPIVVFIEAQLDHDEQVARIAVAELRGTTWQSFADALWKRTDHVDGICDHVELHDPAHVLRQVAAHRRILTVVGGWGHEEADDRFYSCAAPDGGPCSCFLAERRAAVLGPLASIYSDRPGYDPSWTVE